MFKNIHDRQINGKCKKIGSERTIISGRKCYQKMWEVTDKYLAERKRVYLIRFQDKLDAEDIRIIQECDLVFLINSQNVKFLKNINFLETVNEELYDISHINICYVTPINIEYSKEWLKKVL